MRSYSLLLTLGLIALASAARGGDDDLVRLLAGGNLTGFEIVGLDRKDVRLDGGEIRLSGKNHGYLATKREYHDYLLQFEWMYEPSHAQPTDGNSGLLLHIAGPAKVWPQSIEVQIWYKDFGSFYTLGGGKFQPFRDDRAARDKALKPPGQWNLQEIQTDSGVIRVKVNGVDYAEGKAAVPDRGQIGWMYEGSPIRFRKLAIQQR